LLLLAQVVEINKQEANKMEGVKNFTNIDSSDFVGMYDGDKAFIKKGKTVAFPANIARHLAGQLATKILMAMGVDWNKDGRRPAIIAEILGEEIEEVKEAGVITPLKPVKTFEPGEEVVKEVKDETKEVKDEEFADLKEKKAPAKEKAKVKTKAKSKAKK